MATIKKSKANLSAGPSKMTKRAGPIDPKGKWTKVQERTIGNMKAGGKLKKAQDGRKESKNPFVKGYYKKLEKVKSEGNPNNPPLKSTTDWKPVLGIGNSGGLVKHETDTTGYSAGRKEFITKSTSPTGQTRDRVTSRQAVNLKMKKPNSTIRFIPTTLKKGKKGVMISKKK
jgi:hypothetical protein